MDVACCNNHILEVLICSKMKLLYNRILQVIVISLMNGCGYSTTGHLTSSHHIFGLKAGELFM